MSTHVPCRGHGPQEVSEESWEPERFRERNPQNVLTLERTVSSSGCSKWASSKSQGAEVVV